MDAFAHVFVVHELDVFTEQLSDQASQLVWAYYPVGADPHALLSTQVDPFPLQLGCHALQLVLSKVVTLDP